MKKYYFKVNLTFLAVPVLLIAFIIMDVAKGYGQVIQNVYGFSLEQAVAFAQHQNKWVHAAQIEVSAAAEERKDAYNAALPNINLNGSYQRFSDLTLFTDGLRKANSDVRKPSSTSAAIGAEGSFNIYNGGRQHAMQQEYSSRFALSNVNSRDQAGSIGLQTAITYLDLIRFNDLQKFIIDQKKRAEVRLRNINSLYRNQKVTRSDLLRAEVALSNVLLSLEQNRNDIDITNQNLSVLMNLPDSIQIVPLDSAGMTRPEVHSLVAFVNSAVGSSYVVQRAIKNVEIQQAKVRETHSGNLPSLNFYGAYGLNYPNYLFFPPVDQAYAIGFVGVKAQYSISSLYQNKRKVAAGKLRLKELEMQQAGYEDRVRIEVKSYFIKYTEALSKIMVNERSVEQARVNYNIVNKKYLNQLSLLTDLLDADNLYQESRFNLVKAQTDALNIYYHIKYASGNL